MTNTWVTVSAEERPAGVLRLGRRTARPSSIGDLSFSPPKKTQSAKQPARLFHMDESEWDTLTAIYDVRRRSKCQSLQGRTGTMSVHGGTGRRCEGASRKCRRTGVFIASAEHPTNAGNCVYAVDGTCHYNNAISQSAPFRTPRF